jgi:CheY-like chemotaxis protein
MKRIAIIDDDRDYCEVLQAALRGRGWASVSFTTDPLDAERLLLECAPEVVLLDLQMPGLSGEEVYLALAGREQLAGTRWIMLSGLGHGECTMPGDPPLLVIPKGIALDRLEEILHGTRLSDPAPARAAKRHRILVIDDEADFCEVIKVGLEATGRYHVACVCDPLRVDDTLAGPPVDALVLDLRMPGRSGEEVLLSLQADTRWRHVPVVVVTALWSKDGRLSRHVPVSVLPKPVTFERLDRELQQLLARKS